MLTPANHRTLPVGLRVPRENREGNTIFTKVFEAQNYSVGDSIYFGESCLVQFLRISDLPKDAFHGEKADN
jgi:hypothetical protein